MTNSVLVCGSMAFDTIAVFEGRFKEHILADRIHALSVSFLVPSMRKEYGGCSGNIAYSMQLLGGKPVPVATVGEDAGEYLERLQGLGIDVSRIKTIPRPSPPSASSRPTWTTIRSPRSIPAPWLLPRRTT